jgi:DNA polymerase II small subunit
MPAMPVLTKKEIVQHCLRNNILVTSEIITELEGTPLSELQDKLDKILNGEELVLSSDCLALRSKGIEDINWVELEKSKALSEKGRVKGHEETIKIIERIEVKKEPLAEKRGVRIVKSYNEPSHKYGPQDFVSYFNCRFREIEKILRNRQELSSVTSINRLLAKSEREQVSLIGMVKEKATTHSGKIIIHLEDLSGLIKVMIDASKQEAFPLAKSIVNDEIIGVTGMLGNKMVYANSIFLPDIPLMKEVKKSSEPGFAAFLSDIHVGSKQFLKEEFNKFLKWINNPDDERHGEIISNLKYLFIIGDLVDGVGIYPSQDSELEIKDIYDQYRECARLLMQIPQRIHIIICAGNHDAMRLSEPQLPLYREYCAPIYDLPNVTVVSNPAMVNIHASEGFSGFDVLMYHGYSFDYYIQNVDEIRNSGGYDRADLVMKFLLQRRHLSPSHTATLYVPDSKSDPLVIDHVPDFFVTGHIHKTAVSKYRNISLICGSCWQGKTAFQEKVGHHPEPARVPIVNLQTRETKILRF